MTSGSWSPPDKRVPRMPLFLSETELEQLIANFDTDMAALLLLLKETVAKLARRELLRSHIINASA